MQANTEQAERLILAAGGRDTELVAVIDAIGAKQVTALAVEEVLYRSRPPSNTHLMQIQLDLMHGAERFSRTLGVRSGEPISVTEGAADTAIVRLEFDLTELVRILYGPPRERAAGTHRVELRLEQPAVREQYLSVLREAWFSIGQAVDTVLSGCSSRRPDLNDLSVRYGSDKWGMLHWFTPHYEQHLAQLRDEPVRVLEIGIGGYKDPADGGASLRMWKAFFPRGIVTGLDIFPKHGLDETRLRTVQGDQNDPAFLESLAAKYGPFDVIIDDGSHINEHVITSFQTLFRHVRPGGVYVIEDLFTTYCPGFGGVEDPVAPAGTSIGMLKSVLDHLHFQDRLGEPGSYPAELIVGLHVYHNLAVIERGLNAEGGVPAWIPRSFDALVDGPN
ncbi:class I SAM-dependent methyltransferase [Nocardia sp. NPDC020380]|uniref:class I SAM-dependent methyltransferase n=1 Tax=Nocardia sp. NPDC020380 TaxID=3364309 RepID=UPI00378F61F2